MAQMKQADQYVRDAEMPSTLAETLLAQLTLDEKISLVTTYFPTISPDAERLGMIPSAGFNPGVERVGIPQIRMTDASLGIANPLNGRPDDVATALPSGLATAATFDAELARKGGAMIGAEARAKTFNVLLAGGANLSRDPWAGRNFEYLGEDALLAGVLAGAAIDGVQSNHVASTVKHFVLNPQETGRMVMDARIDETALRESDLLAFEIAIERGKPASVMGAYNKVNGDYACESDVLINGILKGDWAYPGWVMSDWGAVHSTEKAALAGLDQESGIELDVVLNGAVFFTERLKAAVEAGTVSMSRLDDMVRRQLEALIEIGVFEHPAPDEEQEIDFDAHALVAQAVAEAGTVLLKNDGVLPLVPSLSRIAVIGGHADVGVISGAGSSQVRSVGGVPIETPLESGDAAWFARVTYHASSPLDAIRKRVPNSDVTYCDGSDSAKAKEAASGADVVIIFATQWQTEAMDVETLHLPDNQDSLIEAVASANPNTIVVLETGGPVLMPWLGKVRAVMQAWYPGQNGGQAIARLLFGDVSPSGRLPMTFPARAEQAPRSEPGGIEHLRARDAARASGDEKASIAPFAVDYHEGANVGYRWYHVCDEEPLFEFGFGLSYTEFAYSGLVVKGGEKPAVNFDLANTGSHRSAEVAQAYVLASDSSGEQSWRLAGFARLLLEPGQSASITIELEPRTYAQWDNGTKQWRLPAGPVPVAIGQSCRRFVLKGMLPEAKK